MTNCDKIHQSTAKPFGEATGIEQMVRFSTTNYREVDVLPVGGLLGAERVVFDDVIINGTQYNGFK